MPANTLLALTEGLAIRTLTSFGETSVVEMHVLELFVKFPSGHVFQIFPAALEKTRTGWKIFWVDIIASMPASVKSKPSDINPCACRSKTSGFISSVNCFFQQASLEFSDV